MSHIIFNLAFSDAGTLIVDSGTYTSNVSSSGITNIYLKKHGLADDPDSQFGVWFSNEYTDSAAVFAAISYSYEFIFADANDAGEAEPGTGVHGDSGSAGGGGEGESGGGGESDANVCAETPPTYPSLTNGSEGSCSFVFDRMEENLLDSTSWVGCY